MVGGLDEEKWAACLGAGLLLCCFGKHREALHSLVSCHQLALHSQLQSFSIGDQCRTDVAAEALCEAVRGIVKICKCGRPHEAVHDQEGYEALLDCFQRYNCNNSQAWSAFFVGWILYKFSEFNDSKRWLNLRSQDLATISLDTSATNCLSATELFYIKCKTNDLLYRIAGEENEWELQLQHLKMWREAAELWGNLDEQVCSLAAYGDSCLAHDAHDKALRNREQLKRLVIEGNWNDALSQATFEELSGSTALSTTEMFDHFKRAVRWVEEEGFLRGPAKSWSLYFSHCAATPGFSPPSSPTRDERLFRCIAPALGHLVQNHGKVDYVALAKHERLIKVSSGMFDTDELKLQRLRNLCEIHMHMFDLEKERRFDLTESTIAEILQLSASSSNRDEHIIYALGAAARQVLQIHVGSGFYFQQEDRVQRGLFEMTDSFLQEAERLARQHNLPWPIVKGILYVRAEFLFRMQRMQEVIEILEKVGTKLLENSTKLVSFSRDRIEYNDKESHMIRMFVAAVLSCNERRHRALIWLERERAQDLLHRVSMSQSTAALFNEGIDEFNVDDDKALSQLWDITHMYADDDTAFLVYTTCQGGVCGSICDRHLTGPAFFLQFGDRHLTGPAFSIQFEDGFRESHLKYGISEIVEALNSKDNNRTHVAMKRLRELYRMLIVPFELKLEEMQPKKLVILPGKLLSGLPFAALHKEPGDPFLIEKYAISYIPSLRMYAHCKHRGQTLMHMGRERDKFRAMVIGDPCGDLDHAAKEAVAIKDLLQNAGFEFEDTKMLQKDDATKSAILDNLPASDWIHYAGHAMVSPDFPHGALLLGQQTSESSSDSGYLSRRRRMMKFARSLPSSQVVSADDIMSSNIEVQALVTVLSACESGFGEARSEGVLGLYRALHVAGAPSVLCSLWKVDDECSLEFMGKLYEKLLEGNELAIALQKVMVDCINDEFGKNADIRSWAAYIISGHPEMKLPRPRAAGDVFPESVFTMEPKRRYMLHVLEEIAGDAIGGSDDTAFLVCTTSPNYHGICIKLLNRHLFGHTHFTRFPGASIATLEDEVQKITESLNSKDKARITCGMKMLQKFYEYFIFPFERQLEEMQPKKLVIITELLFGLPFAALHKDPGGQFLIQKYAISYSDSLQDYDRYMHRGQTLMGRERDKLRAMVIGTSALDPCYADEEAVAMATKDLLQKAGFEDIKLLQKDEATKSAILESLPASDWIHYAGPALFSDEFPHGALILGPHETSVAEQDLESSSDSASTLEEAQDVNATGGEAQDNVSGGISRSLSGRMHARSLPSSKVLTPDDITSSNINIQALVTVLSARQICLGEARVPCPCMLNALHRAGALSILWPMWSLEDKWSMEFMEKVYEKLLEGNELAIALQKVMVECIESENSSVHNWAAYIIFGNPEMKLPRQ